MKKKIKEETKKRVEVEFAPVVVGKLDELAKSTNRARKNYIEWIVLNFLESLKK